MPLTLQQLCQAAGISRQAWYKHLRSQVQDLSEDLHENLFALVDQLRRQHPAMGARKLYGLLRPQDLGRDRFERLLLQRGYRVHYEAPFVHKTNGLEQGCPNLIEGKVLYDVNEVWQADITYVIIGSMVYYLFLITDVYSRFVVGYNLSGSYRSEGCVQALVMALRTRRNNQLQGLIHHSDRGSQYASKVYAALLQEQGIRKSMCREAYENAYQERLHRTLKYEYIYCWPCQNEKQLQANTSRAIRNYNFERPHTSLHCHKAPAQFEAYLKTLPRHQHPPLKIYSHQEHVDQQKIY
jgi:transposase InsO family protein